MTEQQAPATGRVSTRDLWVDLDEFHLRDICLDIEAGEYFVILGPTGAGKTVLLETIAGLLQPRKGHIQIDGQEVTNLPPERRGIGFVYQDYVLFPHLNIARNITFGLQLARVDSHTIKSRVESISRLLGIDHLLHRDPATLSGGEQQRAALARALVVKPRLLLMDEPLSALDPETREALQRELIRLHAELGTTMVHVTHDFEEAVALGDRIAVMHKGRIVQTGTPQDIFRKPETEFVARFVGVRNVLEGEIYPSEDGFRRLLADGGLEIAVVTHLAGRVHASIRPEDIVIAKEALHSSARNCFRATIVKIEDRGTLVYVTARTAETDIICIATRLSVEEMALKVGVEVYLAFKASAVHVF